MAWYGLKGAFCGTQPGRKQGGVRCTDRPESSVEVRLKSLQRMDSLEQVGKEGLPAIRLTATEVWLDYLEEERRDLNEGQGIFKTLSRNL